MDSREPANDTCGVRWGWATAVFAVLAVVMVLVASPASAQYDPDDDSITINEAGTTLVVGEPFTVSAQTYHPDTPVDFTFESDPIHLGTVAANGRGVATYAGITPDVPLGPHTITASGADFDGGTLELSLAVTVVAADEEAGVAGVRVGGASLPRTGASGTETLVRLGIVLTFAGALLMMASRKRIRRRRRMEAVV